MPAGGARPNSGRKPSFNAPTHASNEEKAAREESQQSLMTTAKLSCPGYLTDLAKKEWRRTMKLYKTMNANILCDLDVAALVMYCEAWSIYKTAQEQWTKLVTVCTTNPSAQALIDKTLDVMNKESAIISKLAEQLCLTPVGRARMGINPTRGKAGDALINLLNGQ